jgi:hypothetical protein
VHAVRLTRSVRSRRLLLAALVAVSSGTYVYFYARANPDFVSDFDQVWAGAAAVLRGENPYLVVGPRRAFHWAWPLYYPMPALLLALPLGMMPVVAARVVFAGVSAGLFAYALTRDGFARWPAFISVSFMVNVELVQWSSLLAAAAMTPALSWLACAKPNIGLAIAAAASRWKTILLVAGGAALLGAISFVVLPSWFHQWLENVRAAPHFRPPVTRPGGFLLLLGLLRWRRPEARFFCALACTPLTPTFYDPVLLYVVTRTTREALALSVGTVVLFFVIAISAPTPILSGWGEVLAKASVWVIYVPCLVMLLRRPNEGDIPPYLAWLPGLRRGVARSAQAENA